MRVNVSFTYLITAIIRLLSYQISLSKITKLRLHIHFANYKLIVRIIVIWGSFGYTHTSITAETKQHHHICNVLFIIFILFTLNIRSMENLCRVCLPACPDCLFIPWLTHQQKMHRTGIDNFRSVRFCIVDKTSEKWHTFYADDDDDFV